MKSILTEKRRSGILAHITSLPSPYGIGDIGEASYTFLNYLHRSGQRCWQFLPLNPTNKLFDNSPYMSNSAFAGSHLLVSPELLVKDGYISQDILEQEGDFSPYFVEFEKVIQFKQMIMREAFNNFNQTEDEYFQAFRISHTWLHDHALFMALKDHFKQDGWFDWPDEFKRRHRKSLEDFEQLHQSEILYYEFEQYIFHKQWVALRKKAAELDIVLFGDIPIYVGLDSVDVWAHQEIYELDPKSGTPTRVSGVPPDYFSETGQRWGNPLYLWNSSDQMVQEKLFEWWKARFTAIFELVDVARIDHFRGFESYWAIPAEEETAIRGEWLKGPGASFFKDIEEQLGKLNIVAEDLGIITDDVHALRDELEFPGMKVLQFAFDGDNSNPFLPFNYSSQNCVVYSGTHDNDTSVGWFLGASIDDQLRTSIKQAANRELHDTHPIHQDLLYMALSSISNLSIFPLQDILGFGSDCRLNTPGVPEGNWGWRCASQFLTDEVAESLAALTHLFGRI